MQNRTKTIAISLFLLPLIVLPMACTTNWMKGESQQTTDASQQSETLPSSAFRTEELDSKLPPLTPTSMYEQSTQISASYNSMLDRSMFAWPETNVKKAELSGGINMIPNQTSLLSEQLFASQLLKEEDRSIIVEPMSSEVIDSDIKTGNKQKNSLTMFKDTGDIDPNWDYYAVKARVEDTYAKNDFWCGPLYADLWLFLPDWCEEPSQHEPGAGYRWTGGIASFSYQGIGFDVSVPSYSVSYESTKTRYLGWLLCHWSISGVVGLAWYYPFKDVTDFSVGIRVPEGQKPYCWCCSYVQWYKFNIFWFSRVATEWLYWTYVDPPIKQSALEPPLPPRNPENATIQSNAVNLDAIVISQTSQYTCIGGFGSDAYGWHAPTNSVITLLTIVTCDGQSIEGAPVTFYMVGPESELYDFGDYLTDENGTAWVSFYFSSEAEGGMYTFYAEYDDNEDICGFSYLYCLVVCGYIKGTTTYIEDVILVDEGSVIEMTANPPEGYVLGYWWINYYWEFNENPLYLLIDFDCIVIARFASYSTASCGGSSWFYLR